MRTSLPAGEERRDLGLSAAGVSVLPTANESEDRRFVGHAAVFNQRTAIGNPRSIGFYEMVAPGAFSKTIAEGDARMLIDHDSRMIVSRVSAGTLNLSQDAQGLMTDSKLDQELSYVRDLVANLRNGNVRGMSFGFQVIKDDWAEEEERSGDGDPTKVEVRTLREIKLIEVSAVTFPAYEQTDAGLRYSLVPALRHRGDQDAIARAVAAKPWLGPLLGYDPELAPAYVDLKPATRVYIDGEEIKSMTDTYVEESGKALRAASKKPYGDVAYADPGYQEDGKKRYPIDTEEHAKAAWNYINQDKNAANYTAEQLASIKKKIKAALKKFGVKVSEDDSEKKSSDEPGETTRALDPKLMKAIEDFLLSNGWINDDDTEPDDDDKNEPAGSTRNAPSRHQLAKAALLAHKAKLRRVVA